MSIKRYGTPQAGALPFAKAVEANGFLYVSGQVPRDPNNGNEIVSGSMTVQARQVMENLKNVLETAGYSFNDVIKVDVWIDDPRDFGDFNKIYAQYFTAEHAPARNTVQAMLMSDMRVEVACVAYKSA